MLSGQKKHPHGRGEDHNPCTKSPQSPETPPRAWGRLRRLDASAFARRNTPTGVGKTWQNRCTDGRGKKHPHGRGEDPARPPEHPTPQETPPRAWGRPLAKVGPAQGGGNTPTGVGKTTHRPLRSSPAQKHPHGRGEDPKIAASTAARSETPPRAWGRQSCDEAMACAQRNTPTGVGKTRYAHTSQMGSRKHPHGRGEDKKTACSLKACGETPPRAWGRLPEDQQNASNSGNTPTGVGKTHAHGFVLAHGRKHPHGRGEDVRSA